MFCRILHYIHSDTGLHISQASNNIWKVLHIIPWDFIQICWNIVSRICVWRNIPSNFFYGDLIYKLWRVKCEANFVLSGSKIVKRIWRRKYNPIVIEKTIGLVLDPSTALCRSFVKHCNRANKAGDYITGLVQTSSKETRHWSSSPLIDSRDSFSPWTWARFQKGGAYPSLIFLIYCFITLDVCVVIFMTL